MSEASQWKMDQFLQVLGISSKSKRKGTFDSDDVVGESVKIRVAGDTYNGDYRAKLAAYLISDDDDDDADDDDAEEVDVDDDDDEVEDDEESDDEDDEDDEEEESDEEDEDEEEVAPYEEWDIAELQAEAKARKIKVPPKSKKSTYVKLLEADDSDDDEDDEEDPF